MVDVHRRGNCRDWPALATFVAGGCGAGDCRYSALVDLDQRCIRHEDGQPALVVFLEVGKHLELVIARVHAIHTLKRTDGQCGDSSADRHGTGIDYQNAVGRNGTD